MNEAVTFEWTEELVRAAHETFHNRTLGRIRFVMVGGLIGFILALSSFLFLDRTSNSLTAAIICMLLFVGSLRRRSTIRRASRDTVQFFDDPSVAVTISDESITTVCGKSTHVAQWRKITHFKEWGGFLFLFAGRLSVSTLPTEHFSDDQLDFIRSKVKAQT